MEDVMVSAGNNLRVVREKLGLTMRDVETASEAIARARGNEEFFVPISRLTDFETRGVIPSIYRLSSLATVYRIQPREIFSMYGVNFDSGQHSSEPKIPPVVQDDKQMVGALHREVKQGNVALPVVGCYLLDLLLPRKHRESLVGDIEQDFRTNILPRYGRTAASVWFWKQVVIEIVPGLYLRIAAGFVKRLLGA